MNRTDRLVAMVMYLQGRRVVRAEEMARHFEVTVRTIYRDVAALGEAGVPITGEAGVGYSLVKGYHLPPVMFATEEALALFVGAEMVKRFADASLARPMEEALLKIRSVLPRDRQDDLDRMARAMEIRGPGRLPVGLDQCTLLPIQQATVSRRILRLTYRDKGSAHTIREVEPLGVTFQGGAWYLVAWCRLRGDFRHFRLERVKAMEVTGERFEARPDFSLRRHLDAELDAEDRHPVRVWFSQAVLDRARRESFCRFDVQREADGGAEVAMQTFSLEWLAGWILSFGGEAVALAPVALRDRVASMAAAVARQHARAAV